MKRITLCADDYAITPGVSQAILALADNGRLHATSCMVTTDHWQKSAPLLKPYTGKIDIGLHLNLTEGKGLSPAFTQGYPRLQKLLINSHLRLLNRQTLLQEIQAQIEHFIHTTGHKPDFIDGHQHVHHLPQVRQALLTVMKATLPETTWVRSVTPLINPIKSLKSHVIERSGAKALRSLLAQAGYPTNKGFAGVYSLTPEEAFRPLMQAWLMGLPDKGLIMCHPGYLDDNTATLAHAEARQIEYDYLSSEDFSADCKSTMIQCCRLSDSI